LFWLSLIWILPLFPAEPKLGPVYNRITHFIPPLIIVPAFFLDLVFEKSAARGKWVQAVVGGAVFVGALVAVQWPMGSFLLSHAARNWFFGAHYLDYGTPPTSSLARFLFARPETPQVFWTNLAVALAAAIVLTRLGMGWAESMRRVRR